MYRIHDYVVCADFGVCEIMNIAPFCCDNLAYEVLPVGSDEPASILFHQIKRPVMTKEAAREVIERMPFIRTIQAPGDKVRREFYEASMETYDPIEWVKVIKSAYLRQQDKRVQNYELEFAQMARGYLHKELSQVLSVPLEELDTHIQKQIDEGW